MSTVMQTASMCLRSRRFAIASFLLAVLIGGWWWRSRPNLDPRFFGEWHWERTYGDLPCPLPIDGTLTLNRDGSGVWRTIPTNELYAINWHVDRDGHWVWNRVVQRSAQDYLELMLSSLRGTVSGPPKWAIDEASESRIVLRPSNIPDERLILKRLSPADPVR